MPVAHPPHPGHPIPYLRKAEVAHRYGVCERTVDRLVARGLLTGHKIGSSVRFDPSEVEGLLLEDSDVDFR